MPAEAEILQRLRSRIAAIERGENSLRASQAALPFGVDEIDAHLPWGGLATGAIHEILDGDDNNATKHTEIKTKYAIQRRFGDGLNGAVTAFVAGLAGRAQQAAQPPSSGSRRASPGARVCMAPACWHTASIRRI